MEANDYYIGIVPGNYINVYELLILDGNTCNNIIDCKQMIKKKRKRNLKEMK